MPSKYKLTPRLVSAMQVILGAVPVMAQGEDGEDPMLGTTDVSIVQEIGRLYERLRPATLWEELNRDLTGAYSDYSCFKSRIKKETGLCWTMPVSCLEQWGLPDGG